MSYKNSKAARKSQGWRYASKEEKIVRFAVGVLATGVFIYWLLHVMGIGIDEEDIVCTKGGAAYATIFQKLYRETQYDYVCKRGDSK